MKSLSILIQEYLVGSDARCLFSKTITFNILFVFIFVMIYISDKN